MTSLQQLISERLPTHTLASYEARIQAAVRLLSRMCNVDPTREAKRLDLVREHLGRRIGAAHPTQGQLANPVTAVQHQILSHMPTVIEMVLTLSRGEPRGFAYLTQGSAGATLVESLTNLLRGVLELHLASNGSAETATQIADVFHAIFPTMSSLADFSALAQALLVGVVPRDDTIEFKLYFNTRLDTSIPHRQKIMNVLTLCGISDIEGCGRMYDALYQSGGKSRFTGIGVDLADADGRVKMYVHAPRGDTVAFAEELISKGYAHGPVVHAQRLIEATNGSASSRDCEVAFALRGSGPTTLKVTAFYDGKLVSAADGERLMALLHEWHYPTEPIRELLSALSAPDAMIQKFPLHGIGVELTDDAIPKVNVYVQACI